MRVEAFIKESNEIDGIIRPPKHLEILEHLRFVSLPIITLDDLKQFVDIYQPGAVLRDKIGMNIRVGDYIPPYGNPNMAELVKNLLNQTDLTSFELYNKYESLHPFTDGNGRSGRAIWAWHMQKIGKDYSIGFLHAFYYQSLAASRYL